MERDDLIRQLRMTYDDQITYLKDKYGCVKYDYFESELCQRKNRKISRTAEGLYCHHIREDVATCLCDTSHARHYPFEYQKAENLVYCNALEHLALHIKISARMWHYGFLMPGVYYIAHALNVMFESNNELRSWEQSCFSVIKNNFQEYQELLAIAIFCTEETSQKRGENPDTIRRENIDQFCSDEKYIYVDISRGLHSLLSHEEELMAFRKTVPWMCVDE